MVQMNCKDCILQGGGGGEIVYALLSIHKNDNCLLYSISNTIMKLKRYLLKHVESSHILPEQGHVRLRDYLGYRYTNKHLVSRLHTYYLMYFSTKLYSAVAMVSHYDFAMHWIMRPRSDGRYVNVIHLLG